MQSSHGMDDDNSNHPDSQKSNYPHLQMLNRTKSTNEGVNILMNLGANGQTQNKSSSSNEKNKKEIKFEPPNFTLEKKDIEPMTYEVCDGDTFESIALKFNITVNWLKRQNTILICDPQFALSKGVKLNVTKPLNSMIKPLECSLVSGESHDNSQESEVDNELGESGNAYIIPNENTFDFIPDKFSLVHKPLHIKLTLINEDIVVFTPKSQREKMKRENLRNQQIEKTNDIGDDETNSINKTSDELVQRNSEELFKSDENVVDKVCSTNSQDIMMEDESNTKQVSPEDHKELSKQIDNNEQLQSNKNEKISKESPLNLPKAKKPTKPIKVLPDIASALMSQLAQNPFQTPMIGKLNKPKPPKNEQKPKDSEIHNEQSDCSNEKNCVLVITYLSDPLDEQSINALYFRARKEDGNQFSVNLQKAIKKAKSQQEKSKHHPVPHPKVGPSSLPRSKINASSSSPLGFFQSMFQSIKETFSHSNDSNSTDNNDNNQSKNSSIKKAYRRSFSEKSVNPFGLSLLGGNEENDDTLKPRRNSENVISSSQPNRKQISASVMLQVKIIDGPSILFERTEEIDEIRSKLPYRMRSYDWMLIYRLSKDGSSFTNFFNFTRNSGPVVFIMSTSTKERIGAFIPTGFKYSTKYYGSGEAFVFRFVKPKKDKHKSNNEDKSINKKETENNEIDNNNNSTSINDENNNNNNNELNNNDNENTNTNTNTNDENNNINDENKNSNDQNKNELNSNDNVNENNKSNDSNDLNQLDDKNINHFSEPNLINEIIIKDDVNSNASDGIHIDISDSCLVKEIKTDDNATIETSEVKSSLISNDVKDSNNNNNHLENDETSEKDVQKEKASSDPNSTASFSHLEIFRWTSGTSTNFMMAETNSIIIGIGNDKEKYDKNEIDTINSSHGKMTGPAIWIGENLQYASSSPCDTFSSPQLTRKNFFHVIDIEIWKLGFFSNK